MRCQRNIAQQIVDGGADYLLAVKANQGELHQNIQDVFAGWEREGFDQVAHSFQEHVDQNHGRWERRRCWVIADLAELASMDPAGQWGGVPKISYHREADSGAPEEVRYYICSYPAEAAALLWAWPSMKITAGSDRAMPTRTWRWCAAWPGNS